MPRLTYFLEYGCHAVRHHRGRKVHTLAIHMASHFDHEKRDAWFSISMHACGSVPMVVWCSAGWPFRLPELSLLSSISVAKGPQGTQKLVTTAIQ